ncbi:MAG: flagellar basal body rod protein FlgB [Verrucomicrobiota bacterium]
MIDGLFQQTNYVAAKKMLDATMLRHDAIAANLANLETPGYRRIDLAPDFQSNLQHALATGAAERVAALQPALAPDASAAADQRGNSVQLETELAHLAQNTMAHQLETQLVTGSLLKLRLAITGRNA